jgi:Ca2+-binding EF-hand superfamily protein
MRTLLPIWTVAALLATLHPSPVHAQTLTARLLDMLDVKKDGKISRDALPEGRQGMFDRMVQQHGLDAKKTYTRAELETILSGPPSSSGSGGGSSGPLRGTSSGTNHASRSIPQLPDEYRAYDKDGDGQIGLYEWPRARIAEFLALDKNGDGFLTVNELRKRGAPTAKPDDKASGKPAEPAKANEAGKPGEPARASDASKPAEPGKSSDSR